MTGVRVNLEVEDLSEHKLKKFHQVLLSYRGAVPTHVILESEYGRARMKLSDQFLVNPTPQMAARINELFHKNTVQFIVDGHLEDVQT